MNGDYSLPEDAPENESVIPSSTAVVTVDQITDDLKNVESPPTVVINTEDDSVKSVKAEAKTSIIRDELMDVEVIEGRTGGLVNVSNMDVEVVQVEDGKTVMKGNKCWNTCTVQYSIICMYMYMYMYTYTIL